MCLPSPTQHSQPHTPHRRGRPCACPRPTAQSQPHTPHRRGRPCACPRPADQSQPHTPHRRGRPCACPRPATQSQPHTPHGRGRPCACPRPPGMNAPADRLLSAANQNKLKEFAPKTPNFRVIIPSWHRCSTLRRSINPPPSPALRPDDRLHPYFRRKENCLKLSAKV